MPELKHRKNRTILLFVAILCLSCALILALLSTTLQAKQEEAREVDRAKQILLAAGVIQYGKRLSNSEVYRLYGENLEPRLTDARGEVYTFEEAGINQQDYLDRHQQEGYALLPYKLVYFITGGQGYVIPIHGFGLWGPLYGYLALQPDGDTVKGVSWYAPQETPGLGANIQEEPFLAEFVGKKIFQPLQSGETLYKTAPLGITVVKGKVADVIGKGVRAKTAVDGISGATATGNGVTQAVKESLAPYRPFLLKVSNEN